MAKRDRSKSAATSPANSSRRAGAASSSPAELSASPGQSPPTLWQTIWGRLILVCATVLLVSLSFAPVGQFYLAWVGLVPWMLLVAQARTRGAVVWWSWLTGTLVFWASMWWIVYVTVAGAATLMLYLGLYFVAAGLLFRAAGLLPWTGASPASDAADNPETSSIPAVPAPSCTPWRAAGAVALIATIWTGLEWLRGTLFTGLPWLYLGHSQTPFLAMCQVADLTSAYGVTFCVVLINAGVTHLVLRRPRAELVGSGSVVGAVLVIVLSYGQWRISQQAHTSAPGPRVMVVQPVFPQTNTGAKGASMVDIADYHVRETRKALAAAAARGEVIDLVAWSETVLPELNETFRAAVRGKPLGRLRDFGALLDDIYNDVASTASQHRTNLIVGAVAMLEDRSPITGKFIWSRRNSAYFFDRSGREGSQRYDKIHLVPFGEFIPCRDSAPLLYKFFNLFNPYEGDYTVTPGEALTVFPVPPARESQPQASQQVPPQSPEPVWRFVTPICFEDVDSALVARMFRGRGADRGSRRADFIVNMTNDGWFSGSEMPQHLQIAVFRSIENRVPTARSVNNGISGFIDPVGRMHHLIPPVTTGTSAARLTMDSRVTFYTRYGDVFAWLCAGVTAIVAGLNLHRWMKNRRASGR